MKLSGLAMPIMGLNLEHRSLPPSSAELAELWAPYVFSVLSHFGSSRCFFASNFPVDKVGCGYTELWNAYKIIVRDYRYDRDRRMTTHCPKSMDHHPVGKRRRRRKDQNILILSEMDISALFHDNAKRLYRL